MADIGDDRHSDVRSSRYKLSQHTEDWSVAERKKHFFSPSLSSLVPSSFACRSLGLVFVRMMSQRVLIFFPFTVICIYVTHKWSEIKNVTTFVSATATAKQDDGEKVKWGRNEQNVAVAAAASRGSYSDQRWTEAINSAFSSNFVPLGIVHILALSPIAEQQATILYFFLRFWLRVESWYIPQTP